METIKTCIGCGRRFYPSGNPPSRYCCRQCYAHNWKLDVKDSKIASELSAPFIPIYRRNYLTVTEATDYLSVTKQFLYREIEKGNLIVYNHYHNCVILERRQLERWATHKFNELSIGGSMYYSVEGLLAITQKSWSWTFNLLRRHKIPRYKIKGSTRYDKHSFDIAWSIERLQFLDWLTIGEISTLTGINAEICHTILVDGHIRHTKRCETILYPKYCIKYIKEINQFKLL